MGGKSTTSTQTVSIPPEVMARYNAVNARAENVAATPFQPYGNQFVAPLSPTQQAGVQATNVAAGQAQPYYGAAAGLTLAGAQDVGALTPGQIGYYQNPYTQAVVDPTVAALRQQQGQQLSQQQADAIKAGAFGGDRAGIQRAVLQGQQGLATAQAIAPLYQQGYGQAVQTAAGQQGVVAQDLARRMQAGQQLGGLGAAAQQAALQGAQAQLQAGGVEQQTQQADLTARYQQFLQERGYPFQVAQFLANIAMGTGALSGSTTTTTQPSGLFSDERLKHDAKRVGYTDDGLPIYTFKYNNDNKTHMGVMAQDVEKKHPDAVGLAPAGDGHLYKTVDYERVGQKERAYGGGLDASSMGGAVIEPGEYARGGYALGGGLLGDTEMRSIMSNMKQPLGMYQQAGLYGSTPYQTPYGTGLGIRGDAVSVPSLVTAGSLKAPPVSALQQATSAYKQVKDLGEMGSELYGYGEKALEKAKSLTKGKAAGGLVGRGHYQMGGDLPYMAGQQGYDPLAEVIKQGQQQHYSLPKPGEPPKPQEPLKDIMQTGMQMYSAGKMGSAALDKGKELIGKITGEGGLAPIAPGSEITAMPVPRPDALGAVTAGAEAPTAAIAEAAPLAETAAAAAPAAETAAAAAAEGTGLLGSLGSGLGAIGSGIGAAATGIGEGLASLLAFLPFSDERLKDNIKPVGKTFDGQNIYRYDFGDGRTQLGLIAQEVLRNHPDAVGSRDGFLTVDYRRATDDAAPYAYGGLIPREHHNGTEGNIVGDSQEQPKYKVQPRELDELSPAERSVVTTIYRPEGGLTPTGEPRYNILQGGKETFDVSGLHPNRIPDTGKSTAAGAGQFIASTWKDVTGGAPMLPGYQNAATLALAKQEYLKRTGRDLIADVEKEGTITPEMKAAFGQRWMAFAPQGGGLGQAEASKAIDKAAGPPQGLAAYLPSKKVDGKEEVDLKRIIVPFLSGIAGMAAAPTRNFGTALAMGLGAGAQSYANLDKQQADIEKVQAEAQRERSQAGLLDEQKIKVLAERMPFEFQMGLGWVLVDRSDPKNPRVVRLYDQRGNAITNPNLTTDQVKQMSTGGTKPPSDEIDLKQFKPQDIPAEAMDSERPIPGQRASVVTVPVDFMHPNQMGLTQQFKGNEALRAKDYDQLVKQRQIGSNATEQINKLNVMRKQLDNLPARTALEPGKYAPLAYDTVRAIKSLANTFGGDIPADIKNAEAAFTYLTKEQTTLGADMQRGLGREPGFILQQLIAANPGPTMTAESMRRLISGLEQTALYERDKQRFMENWWTNTGHLVDAQKTFELLNPRQAYADRAVFYAIPEQDRAALQTYISNPDNKAKAADAMKRFDSVHGIGSSKIVLGMK